MSHKQVYNNDEKKPSANKIDKEKQGM